jgi:alpha-glucoside transport system substrate-binding protein
MKLPRKSQFVQGRHMTGLGWVVGLVALLVLVFLVGTTGASTQPQAPAQETIYLEFVYHGSDPSAAQGAADDFAGLLSQETGLDVQASTTACEAQVVQRMGAGQTDLAPIRPVAYVLGHDDHGIEARLVNGRFGAYAYRGQINVQAAGGYTGLWDLQDTRFAFTTPDSMSGHYAPTLLISETTGMTPTAFFTEVVFAGGHTQVIRDVYNGAVEGGASYEGARYALQGEYPDVLTVVDVLTYTDPIPNETWAFRSGLDATAAQSLTNGIKAVAATVPGETALETIFDYDLTGISETQEIAFDLVRKAVDYFELEYAPCVRYVAVPPAGSDDSDCCDPADPCATIGYALDQATEGDEVLVAEGTYTENVIIDGKTLTLRGGYTISGTQWLSDADATVVDGNGADRTFLIHGNNSTLESLVITGGDTPDHECWGGGVWVTNGDVTIRDSFITGNWADCSGAGVECNSDWGPAHLTMENSIVFDNRSGDEAGGVSVWHTGAHLANTLIVSNTGSTGSAVRIEDSDVTIQNCTVAHNQGDGSPAINAYNTDGQPDALTLRNTIVWDNLDANLDCTVQTCTVTYSDVGGGWPGVENIDADPWFADPSSLDYHLLPWSPCIDGGTATGAPDNDLDGVSRPQNAGYDLGAYEFAGTPIQNEGTRYVATSGSDAGPNLCLDPHAPCESVGHALGWANAGESVWIADGTYTENLSVTIPVTLSGAYSGPPGWTRSLTQYETILDGSGSPLVPGDWDGDGLAFPRVISDTGQYRMWYNGQNITYPGLGWTLGLADPLDANHWIKYGGNPVLGLGAEGEWDSQYRGQVAVLKDGGLYKMWYSGSDLGPWQTGYATSTNGIDWNLYDGNPVLPVGDGGSWDEQEADGPAVIKDGGLYKMWYHGCNGGYTVCSIGYATSTNGLDWSKHDVPVLTGTGGEWDDGTALWPSVVKDGGTYKMWYYSGDGKIGLATSLDGLNWAKHGGNPVLTDGWDGGGARGHSVTLEGASYRMWLRSGTDDSAGIGYADSTDGISWTMSISNPVLTPGAAAQWGKPVVLLEGGSDGSVLDGLTITGGSGELAGGVEAQSPSLTIRNCLVRDNRAFGGPWDQGAGGVQSGGSLAIEDSRIVDNHAFQGASGVRVHQGHLDMTNVLVAGNRGAMSVHLNGSGTLMNTTVADNDGGVLLNTDAGGVLSLTNSIVYYNDWSVNTDGNAVAQVAYSDIEGGWPGTGNIDADPRFVDPAGGDYHLRLISPGRDQGTAIGAPGHDLEGTPRDERPDMGAYEWTGYATYVPLITNFAGATVHVLVADADPADDYEQAWAEFQKETGIDVVVEVVGNFDEEIRQRALAGELPDVAIFPQPGLLAELAREGHTIDIYDWFSHAQLQQQYEESWLDMATVDGQMAGVWYRVPSIKSLVWYPKDDFDAAGYAIPQDWSELVALSDQMVLDGRTPWCIGIESAGASGWVGTDWVEDIVLRTTTPANYDAWVSGDLAFASPQVSNAWDLMGSVWFEPDYVLGGTSGILNTHFGDAPGPMFDDPPGCWLHRQANFIEDLFPGGAEWGVDYDYFYFPPIDAQYGDPVLVMAEIAGVFHDRVEVTMFTEYLTRGESVRWWAETGRGVSPHKDADLGWYPAAAQGYAQMLMDADTVRFDASDQMPDDVMVAFWDGIVDYVNGANLNVILWTIDQAWPE